MENNNTYISFGNMFALQKGSYYRVYLVDINSNEVEVDKLSLIFTSTVGPIDDNTVLFDKLEEETNLLEKYKNYIVDSFNIANNFITYYLIKPI